MSRHVRNGVAERGVRDMDTHLRVCPVPLPRPFALAVLAIGAPLRGKPNELDSVHLAAGHHAARN